MACSDSKCELPWTSKVRVALDERLGVDQRAVVALQAVLALTALNFVRLWSLDTLEWFTEDSFLDPNDPMFAQPEGAHWWQRAMHWRGGGEVFVMVQFACIVVLSLAILLRFYPRVACGLLFLVLTCVHGKIRGIEDSASRLLRHMLLWAMLLPDAGEASEVGPARQGRRPLATGLAAFGAQFQLLYMYSVLVSERRGHDWMGPDFSAVYYALSGPCYSSRWGIFVAHEFPGMCRFLTVATMVIEGLAPVVVLLIPVWSWWRAVPAVTLASMHLGIMVLMTLHHFSFIAAFVNVVYLPAPFWDALEDLLKLRWLPTARDYQQSNSHWKSWMRTSVAAVLLLHLFFCTEICGMMLGRPRWRDQAMTAIDQNTHVDQLWMMYDRLATTGFYWDIRATVKGQGDVRGGDVDVLAWLRGELWEPRSRPEEAPPMPTCFSCLYRSTNWEMYLQEVYDRGTMDDRALRVSALARWICVRGQGLETGTVTFVVHGVKINPPGSSLHYTSAGELWSTTLSCANVQQNSHQALLELPQLPARRLGILRGGVPLRADQSLR